MFTNFIVQCLQDFSEDPQKAQGLPGITRILLEASRPPGPLEQKSSIWVTLFIPKDILEKKTQV